MPVGHHADVSTAHTMSPGHGRGLEADGGCNTLLLCAPMQHPPLLSPCPLRLSTNCAGPTCRVSRLSRLWLRRWHWPWRVMRHQGASSAQSHSMSGAPLRGMYLTRTHLGGWGTMVSRCFVCETCCASSCVSIHSAKQAYSLPRRCTAAQACLVEPLLGC